MSEQRAPITDRPSPPSARPALSSGADDGWQPAHADDTPRAVAWRARTSLRRADRALETIEQLGEKISHLTTSIEGWTKTWEGHLAAGRRAIVWALRILGGLAVAGGGIALWRWLSTLHH